MYVLHDMRTRDRTCVCEVKHEADAVNMHVAVSFVGAVSGAGDEEQALTQRAK